MVPVILNFTYATSFKIVILFLIVFLPQLMGCVSLNDPLNNFWVSDHKKDNLKNLVKKKPDDIDLKISLGRLYLASNHFEEAFGIFKEVLTNRPSNNESLFLLGTIYLNILSKINEAKNHSLKEYYGFKTDKPFIKILKGVHPNFQIKGFATRNGKLTSEIKLFLLEKKFVKTPLKLIAEKFLEFGLIEQALDRNNKLGKSFFEKAKLIAEKNVRMEPKRPENHLLLGTIYGNLQKYEQAISQLKKAIDLLLAMKNELLNEKDVSGFNEDDLAEAYFYLGVSFKRLQMLEDIYVPPLLRFGIEIVAIPVNLLRNLLYQEGTAGMAKNNFPKAIDAFKNSIKIRPSWIEPRYNLAETYQLSNQLENSITEFIELRKIKGDDLNIEFSLSCLYKMKGNTKKAVKYLISGLELFKENQKKSSKLINNLNVLADFNIPNLNILADFNIPKPYWSPMVFFSPYVSNCNF